MGSTRRRAYDHRIRAAIVASGDTTGFSSLNIPRSTRRSWLRRGLPNVITTEPDDIDVRVQLAKLQRRVEVLTAVVRLLLALVRATQATLTEQRIPMAWAKRSILRAIARATPHIGHSPALRILGLRPARLRQWTQADDRCELDDAPPCPRSVPARLTVQAAVEGAHDWCRGYISYEGLAHRDDREARHCFVLVTSPVMSPNVVPKSRRRGDVRPALSSQPSEESGVPALSSRLTSQLVGAGLYLGTGTERDG